MDFQINQPDKQTIFEQEIQPLIDQLITLGKKYDMPIVLGIQVWSDMSDARVRVQSFFNDETTAQLVYAQHLMIGAVDHERLEILFDDLVIPETSEQIN